MKTSFNYHHLHYFWVVAREGSMVRAAERLGMAVQTVSAQVRELERSLGHTLLKPAGRGLSLTDAGRAVLSQADPIFQMGEALPQRLREVASGASVRLAVGIPDSLPKLTVQRLLAPVLSEPRLRLLCHDGEMDDLLGELALHRLDVVLSDGPAPPHPNLRLYSHTLGQSPVSWYASPSWAAQVQRFPQDLAQVPVVLPTGHAALRPQLEAWLDRQGLRPRVAGEVEDSALLVTLAAGGLGAFAAADWSHEQLVQAFGAVRLGPCDGVGESYFAIGTEKRVHHPLVLRLLPGIAG